MISKDVSLNTAVKAEWDTLRAEIVTRDAQNFQLMTGSIAAYVALLSLFITFARKTGVQVAQGAEHGILLPVILYYIPFAVILPSIYFVLNNVHAIKRIAGYIEIYLEPKSDLQWEGSLNKFYKELDNYYKRCTSLLDRYGTSPFEEAKVIFVVFVGLGVLNGIVFFIRGDWSVLPGVLRTQWLGETGTKWVVLTFPFLFFFDAYRKAFGPRSVRTHYRNIWETVHTQQSDDACQQAFDRLLRDLEPALERKPDKFQTQLTDGSV